MNLSKIEIIIGMSKFSDLKSALSKIGVRGMTVMQVLGCGVEKGTYEFEIETNEEMELLPKQQINIVVETEKVDEIIELVKQEMYTGHIGDGKIFVYDITNVVRIRTGDEGVDALQYKRESSKTIRKCMIMLFGDREKTASSELGKSERKNLKMRKGQGDFYGKK